MRYTKTNPCDLCPFRNDDKRLYVGPSRLKDFASGPFVCHKTAEYEEGEISSGYVDNGSTSQHCAGALIFHEHLELTNDQSQLMQVTVRLARMTGIYDNSKLNMNAPVFKSWEEIYAKERN